MSLPAMAMAATTAVTTADLNVRVGPDGDYARITTIPNGDRLTVYGCVRNYSWCDISWDGYRGWVFSDYLAYYRDNRRFDWHTYAADIGFPIVTFSFGDYHDRYYRDRPWYRHRDRDWDRGWDRDRDRRRGDWRDRDRWDRDRDGRRGDWRDDDDDRRDGRRGDWRDDDDDRRDGRRGDWRDNDNDRRDGRRGDWRDDDNDRDRDRDGRRSGRDDDDNNRRDGRRGDRSGDDNQRTGDRGGDDGRTITHQPVTPDAGSSAYSGARTGNDSAEAETSGRAGVSGNAGGRGVPHIQNDADAKAKASAETAETDEDKKDENEKSSQ